MNNLFALADIDRVAGVATRVRQTVVDLVKQPPIKGSVSPTTLRGGCGIATWELWVTLRALRYDVEAVFAESIFGNHAYVVVGRRMRSPLWVDITIAQYGGPPVAVSSDLDALSRMTTSGAFHWAYRRARLEILSTREAIINALDWGIDRTHPVVLEALAAAV